MACPVHLSYDKLWSPIRRSAMLPGYFLYHLNSRVFLPRSVYHVEFPANVSDARENPDIVMGCKLVFVLGEIF